MSCSSAPVTAMSRSRPGKSAAAALTPWATERCARAARGGRPGGSTSPPGPPGSAPSAATRGRRSGRAARAAGAPGPSRSAREGRPRGARPGPAGPRPCPRGRTPRRGRRRTFSIVIARPNWGWTAKRPLTWTIAPGRGELEALADVLPGDRLDGAGAVGDDQLEEVLAVSLLAQLALADARTSPRPPGRRRGRGRSGGRSPTLPRRAEPGLDRAVVACSSDGSR